MYLMILCVCVRACVCVRVIHYVGGSLQLLWFKVDLLRLMCAANSHWNVLQLPKCATISLWKVVQLPLLYCYIH